MTEDTFYKAGELVRAFDPRTLGVVKHGRIISIGPKTVYIDFGFSGKVRMLRKDIVGPAYERGVGDAITRAREAQEQHEQKHDTQLSLTNPPQDDRMDEIPPTEGS